MRHAIVLAPVLIALAAAGCARTQAKTIPELPPLQVPVAPPRVVEAIDPATPVPGTLVEEPARNTPRPRPQQPARSEPARSDPAAVEAPPPAEAAAPPATDQPVRTPSTPTLQTTPASGEQDVERSIVTLVAQARQALGRVQYERLNPNARTQYNQARQFMAQAEDAMRDRNFVFALTNAEKAAKLAMQLAGR